MQFTKQKICVRVIDLLNNDEGVSEPVYIFLCELLASYEIYHIQNYVQHEESERGIQYFFLDTDDAMNLKAEIKSL